mmetsp:Transcript_60187/g.176627  ORF Transcript_60187/g.176627 Transcript_60187/m.176627 type:complete len:302 (-) Transcript_60187:17-922(-)
MAWPYVRRSSRPVRYSPDVGIRLLLWTFELSISIIMSLWQLMVMHQEAVLTEENSSYVEVYLGVPVLISTVRLCIGSVGWRSGSLTQIGEYFVDGLAVGLLAWFMVAGAFMILSGFANELTKDGRQGHMIIGVPGLLSVLNAMVVYERLENGRFRVARQSPVKPGPEPAGLKAIQKVTTFGEMPDLTQAVSTCLVCLDDFEWDDKAAKLTCGHVFHEKCIKPWLLKQALCPLRCELGPKALAPEPVATRVVAAGGQAASSTSDMNHAAGGPAGSTQVEHLPEPGHTIHDGAVLAEVRTQLI